MTAHKKQPKQPPLKTLKQLADDYDALKAATRQYWDQVLGPKVEACASRDEFEALCVQVSVEATSDTMRIRDLPADISVKLVMARQQWLEFDSKVVIELNSWQEIKKN